ncbi:MAG: PaaI family thioesterase [Solirubrobacterales bacterium]
MERERIVPAGFSEEIGVEWIDLDPDNARARIKVEERHMQAFGIVHGGVYASLAESLCSAATYVAVRDDGQVALGMANNTTFLRPISSGYVNALARVRQRGRTTWIWDCELTDDDGRVCALVRMTAAVRPHRD